MPSATQPTPGPAAAVPWYLWTGALAVTSATIGGQWDVAWHRSIGRDDPLGPRPQGHLRLQAARRHRLRVVHRPMHWGSNPEIVETGVFDTAVH